ncbi:glutaredoxin-related protein [Natronospira proteinivora]|uniref:Glutaredoxin-related protein n=1 Tax=Natronospira proteinivora TaxID=1807133 RepID=A0ABT1G835_9GAMM|nr:DUF3429 family protein [Natronospira proteinivora]MCP1727472.1 glutaredoxin-related protein [Natronospira proteinivora]
MSSHEQAIEEMLHSADVVVFCSRITETDLLEEAARERGQRYREIRMGMGDASMRERFHVLQTMTGQKTLPQVFVNGEFVGGLRAYLGKASDRGAVLDAEGEGWVKGLGYAGLLPLLFALIAMAWNVVPAAGTLLPDSGFFLKWSAAYAAVILSFLGATHWGMALSLGGGAHGKRHFIAAVIPSLWAWLALLNPDLLALPMLIGGFMAWWLYERQVAADLQLPAWYRRLRSQLSAGVILLLSLTFMLALLIRQF